MNGRVKIKSFQIECFKNVIQGKVTIPVVDFKEQYQNVLGIYGQNGSGKTAVVDAFQLLSRLVRGQSLPSGTELLIHEDHQFSVLSFNFLVDVHEKLYEVGYTVKIKRFEETSLDEIHEDQVDYAKEIAKAYVESEELKYKELVKGARPKTIVTYYQKTATEFDIKPAALYKEIKQDKNDGIITCKVNAQLAYQRRTAFLFRKEVTGLLESVLDKEAYDVLAILKEKLSNNLLVVTNQESSLILANLLLPIRLEVSAKERYRHTLFNANLPQFIELDKFEEVKFIFENISKVLKEIVPGLSIEVRGISEETIGEGKLGMRVEFLSNREGKRIPLFMESDGIKKLISILGYLVAVYNNEDVCIIIDELDAGIFEFLLGEIIKILNENGKGQLIFTSHNLRPLELLKKENLIFTTANPTNRYIAFKGIKETNNIRDVYIRAIQLGYEGNDIYQETDKYDIMDAFEEIGEQLYGKK